MTDTKYTFYLCSDRNARSKSTDASRLKKIGATLRDMGHSTHYIGVGPNVQWSAPGKGCTGENDVLLVVCSGIDVGVLEEWGNTLGTYWKAKFKKAHPFMIKLMSGTEKRTVGTKQTIQWGAMDGGTSSGFYQSIGQSWDANYGTRLNNPASYCEKHGISFLQGGGSNGINDILERLKKGEIYGSGISLKGNSTSPTNTSNTSNTVTTGYNTSTPFQGYLIIGYIVKDKEGNKSKIKEIIIDWSEEAPDKSNKWSSSNDSTKDIALSWVNDRHTKYEINILDKIKSVEKKYDEKSRAEDTNTYLIKYVDFASYTPKANTSSTDNSNIYDPNNDKSTHKMNLYSLGFFSGDIINNKTLGVSTKTLMDSIKVILDETNYQVNMSYAVHRDYDTLNFRTVDDSSLTNVDKLEEFNEFVNGNIIGVSNIKFSPISDMVNNNIVIYKRTTKEVTPTTRYHHTRTSNLENIIRYAELTKVSKSDVITSYAEAKQKSYDNYLNNYNTQITYTARVAGLPYTQLNDYVQAVMIDERLSGAYQICSKNIYVSTATRPMVQCDVGMGAIDYETAIYKNLEAQRKELVKFKADINEPISYEGMANIVGDM